MIDLNNFIKQAEELIFYLDEDNARKILKKISIDDMRLINNDSMLKKAFIALRFLIIPFLHTNEIVELLKDNIAIGLNLEELDITERIRKKLIFLHITDRDSCKKILKDAIVKNQETIIKLVEIDSSKKLKTVVDWLKDYIVHTSLKGGGSLARANYFQSPYFSKLADKEKEVLKRLFALYNFLNISSFSPEGFEDDLLLKTKDGRLVTTNKGKVVVLYDPKKSAKKPLITSEVRASKNQKIEIERTLDELRKILADYPAGSLERKAIEEEIEKLNKEL